MPRFHTIGVTPAAEVAARSWERNGSRPSSCAVRSALRSRIPQRFFLLRSTVPVGLEVYIIGSSFLHFIYDGWIWKMRKPSVGRPLELSYPEPARG